MASDFDTFLKEFDGMIIRLDREFPKEMAVAGNDSIALIQQRLQESGKDDTGNAFRPYSEEYLEYKISKGKYRGFVDFTFQDRMLNNVQIIQSSKIGHRVVLVINAQSQENKEKLEHNSRLRKPLLNMSKKEQKIVGDDFFLRIGKIVTTSFRK